MKMFILNDAHREILVAEGFKMEYSHDDYETWNNAGNGSLWAEFQFWVDGVVMTEGYASTVTRIVRLLEIE